MLKPHFWTPKTVAQLGTATDKAIAKRLGLSPSTVFMQRSKRGIKAHGRLRHTSCAWGQTELGLLRNFSDREIARLTGRSLKEIAAKRHEMMDIR
jgi:hypothetical protein